MIRFELNDNVKGSWGDLGALLLFTGRCEK